MGSLAILAREKGIKVTGSDQNVYPPMSTQLEVHHITLTEGYEAATLKQLKPDLVIVGNAMKRGNPAIEYMLNENLPFTSGPAFLAQHILADKQVIAVAGTHGKTTTSSMVAWLLENAGQQPGFLIGGVPSNFSVSARSSESSPFFVVEADEYDTAFFDKRSKFIHYKPYILTLNNLEFDHADIFDSLADIQKQVQHLIRIIRSNGHILAPSQDKNIRQVLKKGCWSHLLYVYYNGQIETTEPVWHATPTKEDCSQFEVKYGKQYLGKVSWEQTGLHNMHNGLMAILSAWKVGIPVEQSCENLCQFAGVKRRMEKIAYIKDITLYDDFAHHPTAIETTLKGLRAKIGDSGRVIAVIEPRSNSMKMGVHRGKLCASTTSASQVYWFRPQNAQWQMSDEISHSSVPALLLDSTDKIIDLLIKDRKKGDHIVIMSNGSFNGLSQKLVEQLRKATNHDKK